MPVNEYGQMIGESMEGYTPGELPSIDFLEGRYARIEALSSGKACGGFVSCLWLQIRLGRCGPTSFRNQWQIWRNWLPFKSDVGS